MTRIAGFLAVTFGIVIGSRALAQESPPKDAKGGAAKVGVTNPTKSGQINRQLSFIDLYLTHAMNNAKLLSAVADLEATDADKAIIAEAKKNLDAAIGSGLTHVQKLRSYKNELSMAAGGTGAGTETGDRIAKVDEVERQLKEAKAATGKLTTGSAVELSTQVDGVATHLMGADAAFRDVAKWTNYTRLGSTNLGTVPVRGGPGEEPTGVPAPSTPGSMTPGSTTPGSMAPSQATPETKTPGTTPPPREPVQPAPGAPPPPK
jgi:hypothetical protein